MKTVVLDVRSPNDAMADFVRVWKTGKGEKAARMSYTGTTVESADGQALAGPEGHVRSRPSVDSRSGTPREARCKVRAYRRDGSVERGRARPWQEWPSHIPVRRRES